MEVTDRGESLQDFRSVVVQDSSHTAEARRNALELASSLGFSEIEAGNLALIVTEAARNLLKHAGGGELILHGAEHDDGPTVEMLAVDKGPGMEDISRSFRDGYSTAGTPGTGLGAISRLASLHDIYSQPRQGTVLLAQIARRGVRPSGPKWRTARFRVGAVSVPKPGEPVSGDASAFSERAGIGRLIVADGLGHGLLAADAARAAVRAVIEHPDYSGVSLMRRIHTALRPTRGAAVAIAEPDAERGVLRYTGIGNVSASIISRDGRVQHLVSHAGTAGHEAHKIAEFSYRWEPGSLLIMHSDGLGSHWSLERYPGLVARHPSLIAGILYRDFNRGRDDATVVVLEETGRTAG